MLSDNEPRFHTTQASLGNGIQVDFKGEQFKGLPILDTAVTINGKHLCSITWEERFHFIEDLEKVIEQYRI